MTTESNFQIPSGYERGIRFSANWTMIISPYMILYFIFVIIFGNINDPCYLSSGCSSSGDG